MSSELAVADRSPVHIWLPSPLCFLRDSLEPVKFPLLPKQSLPMQLFISALGTAIMPGALIHRS